MIDRKRKRTLKIWLMTAIVAVLALLGETVKGQDPEGGDAPVIATVQEAPQVNGTVEGSVWMLSGRDYNHNGGALITGDLQVPGTPEVRVQGNPAFGGTVDSTGSANPSNYRVIINSNSTLRKVIRRVNPTPLPPLVNVTAPTGTRRIVISRVGESPGSFATIRDLTMNSHAGDLAVPPGAYGNFIANNGCAFILGVQGATSPSVYHFQSLAVRSELRLVGPVIINVANNMTVDSHAKFSIDRSASWLRINARSAFTLNSHSQMRGHVVAPAGTVIVNSDAKLCGTVVARGLKVNSRGILTHCAEEPDNQPPIADLKIVDTDEEVPVAIGLTGTDPEGTDLGQTSLSSSSRNPAMALLRERRRN